MFTNRKKRLKKITILKNDFLKIHFWTPFRQNFQKLLVPLEAQELADSKNGLEVMIWWRIDGVIKVWKRCKIVTEQEQEQQQQQQEQEYIAKYYNWLCTHLLKTLYCTVKHRVCTHLLYTFYCTVHYTVWGFGLLRSVLMSIFF